MFGDFQEREYLPKQVGHPPSPLQHVLIWGQLAHTHEKLPGKCCTFPQLFSSRSAVFQLTSVLPSWVLPDSPVPPRTQALRSDGDGLSGPLEFIVRLGCLRGVFFCLCSVLSVCFFTRAHSNSDFPVHHPTDKVRRHHGRALFRAHFPFLLFNFFEPRPRQGKRETAQLPPSYPTPPSSSSSSPCTTCDQVATYGAGRPTRGVRPGPLRNALASLDDALLDISSIVSGFISMAGVLCIACGTITVISALANIFYRSDLSSRTRFTWIARLDF